MKTAISATGNNQESTIDKRFARCNFFVIHDSETGSVEYLPNPAKDAEDGAGPAAVQLLAARKINRIVSGEFGFKIKPLLDSLKIQMIVITNEELNVGKVIRMLEKNEEIKA